jgi:hypothetical protein
MAIPVAVLAAIAAAAAAGGTAAGAKGADAASRKDTKAKNALKENKALYEDMSLPEMKDVNYGQDNWLGDYTPDTVDPRMAQATNLDGTAFDDVSSDPRLKDAQLAALASLKDVGANGMTAQEKADLARVQSEVGQADRGRRDAIEQNMAARGMGGSGMNLLAQLQSSQAATDRAAQQGLDIEGMKQNRMLDALSRSGTLAGNIRGQDFGEQSAVAGARDAVARFNAQNSTQNNQFNVGQYNGGQQFNAGANNEAGRFNTAGRQGIYSNNINQANKQQYTNNVDLPGARADMQFKRTSGMTGANKDLADIHEKGADRDAQMWGGISSGLFGIGGAAAQGMMKSDKHAKKNVTDFKPSDIDEFLKALKPKKFEYKEGEGEPGEKIGFLMQDIEKSKAGKDISRTTEDGMKAYDTQSLQGITLAALKHLAKKVEEK